MTNAMSRQTVPLLEPFCVSWIAVSRETGKAVFETYSRKTAKMVNQEKYEVLTAATWLARFNKSVIQTRESKERKPQKKTLQQIFNGE